MILFAILLIAVWCVPFLFIALASAGLGDHDDDGIYLIPCKLCQGHENVHWTEAGMYCDDCLKKIGNNGLTAEI